MLTTKFKVSPLSAVVLLYNVTTCVDAANDADMTVGEIITDIDGAQGMLSKGLLESALYCCNINSEDKKFWHPFGHDIDQFIKSILHPKYFRFDKYYHTIYEVKLGTKKKPTENSTVGQDS